MEALELRRFSVLDLYVFALVFVRVYDGMECLSCAAAAVLFRVGTHLKRSKWVLSVFLVGRSCSVSCLCEVHYESTHVTCNHHQPISLLNQTIFFLKRSL